MTDQTMMQLITVSYLSCTSRYIMWTVEPGEKLHCFHTLASHICSYIAYIVLMCR